MCKSPQLCHPDRNRSPQCDDLEAMICGVEGPAVVTSPAVRNVEIDSELTGGPLKACPEPVEGPGFASSGVFLPPEQSFPAARSCFRAVHSDSISTRPSQPV